MHQAKKCLFYICFARFFLFCFLHQLFLFLVLVFQLFAWIFEQWNTLGILHFSILFFILFCFFAWHYSACVAHHHLKQ